MSQKEMDAMDQEVFRVANKELKTESEIPRTTCAPARNDTENCGRKYEEAAAAEKMRQVLWTAIKVLFCILVAALFIVAMVDPGFVVQLVNIGVLTCGIVAAIIIDRFLRGR